MGFAQGKLGQVAMLWMCLAGDRSPASDGYQGGEWSTELGAIHNPNMFRVRPKMVFLSDCGVATLSAMLIDGSGGHGPPYASRRHRTLHSNKNPKF
jgi:hypothetical protein